MTRIVHLTSVHPPDDTRIAVRECMSLLAAGYEVFLVARDAGRPPLPGLPTTLLDLPNARLPRILLGWAHALRAALQLRGAIYHLHDPELIPTGLILKVLGKRVVYDAHEDIAKQVEGKDWIPRMLRRPVAAVSGWFERLAGRAFDGVIVVTPTSVHRFDRPRRSAIVRNLPLWREFEAQPVSEAREPIATYVGSLTPERGLWTMIDAIGLVGPPAKLVLVGTLSPALAARAQERRGWDHVVHTGWQTRGQIAAILSRSQLGLAVLQPLPNYLDSYPTKLFEYMASGVPSVVSDFPPWRDVVHRFRCGLTVDPLDVAAVASAVERLLRDREMAGAMAARGRNAIRDGLNWEAEVTTLIRLYESMGVPAGG